MKKRRYLYLALGIGLVCLTALFLSPPFGSCVKTAETDGERMLFSQEQLENIHGMQVISAESRTQRTISWQLPRQAKSPAVEYRLRDTGRIEQGVPEETSFDTDERKVYLYTARLSQLEPDKSYEYRIVFNGRQTEWRRFDTAGTGAFKALIFPDSQSADYSGWAKLVQAAWQANQDAKFFVNLGDLVDNGDTYWQWRSWLKAVDPMIARIPFAPVQGNHETYTRDWKVQMPKTFLSLFQVPGNGSSARQNQYYSFDYGDVHFAVFNTQHEEMEEFQPGLLAEELIWLEQDLAQSKAKWKVVLLHKDLFRYPRQDGDNGEITALGRTLMPIFDRYQVDAVLSAHLHTYRRRQPLRDFTPNPQGTLYVLAGVAGDVRYPDLWKRHTLDVALAPQPETDNYMVMEVGKTTLKLTAFLPSGEKFDEVVLEKE